MNITEIIQTLITAIVPVTAVLITLFGQAKINSRQNTEGLKLSLSKEYYTIRVETYSSLIHNLYNYERAIQSYNATLSFKFHNSTKMDDKIKIAKNADAEFYGKHLPIYEDVMLLSKTRMLYLDENVQQKLKLIESVMFWIRIHAFNTAYIAKDDTMFNDAFENFTTKMDEFISKSMEINNIIISEIKENFLLSNSKKRKISR